MTTRIRLFLSTATIAAALLTLAPAAVAMTATSATTGSSASYIKVTTTPTLYYLCMPAADKIRAKWKFVAKVKRSGTSLPKKVRVSYKITDLTTGTVVGSEVLYLKPRKFQKYGAEMDYVTGHQMQYDFKSQYRAPNSGKMITAKSKQTDTVPSAQEFVDAGAPACAAG